MANRFIVEGRDNLEHPAGEYPLVLVYIRERLAGPVFEFKLKVNSTGHVFTDREKASIYAVKEAARINKKWTGLKEIVYKIREVVDD